jgi:F-type H+-transporting ATPase subunit epsilon
MALPAHLTFELVTPDHGVVTEQVDEVQLPGTLGYLDVLPGHTPLMTTIEPGELWYRKGQQRTYVSVSRGIAEVLPDRVTILARAAERAEEIDAVRAEAERQRAESEMRRPNATQQDLELARIAMLKSLARLKVASRARTRG